MNGKMLAKQMNNSFVKPYYTTGLKSIYFKNKKLSENGCNLYNNKI